MAKYTKELQGITERANEILKSSGYSVKVNHQNGYTVIYITNLATNSTDLLTAGHTAKTAMEYLYCMCKAIGLVTYPAYSKTA